jgi:hypothetical protein
MFQNIVHQVPRRLHRFISVSFRWFWSQEFVTK